MSTDQIFIVSKVQRYSYTLLLCPIIIIIVVVVIIIVVVVLIVIIVFLYKKLLELLEHPLADPNARDKNGDAPLHSYISRNKQYRAELLIAILSGGRNTDVNIRNEGGHTPLHIAVQVREMI